MMNKAVRIYDLARRLAIPSREIIDLLKTQGIEVSSHMNTIEPNMVDLILKTFGPKKNEAQKKPEVPSQYADKPRPEKKPPMPHVRSFAPPPQETLKRPFVPRHPDRALLQSQPRQPSVAPEPSEKPYPPEKRERQFPPRDSDRKPGQYRARPPYNQDRGRGPGFQKRREPFGRDESQVKGPSRKEAWAPPVPVVEEKPGAARKAGKLAAAKRHGKPAEEVRHRNEKQEEDFKELPPPRPVKKTRKDLAVKENRPAPQKIEKIEVEERPKGIRIRDMISVKDLAEQMNVPPAKVIMHLMTMGLMPNVNQMLEPDAAKTIVQSLGFEVEETPVVEEVALSKKTVVDQSKLRPRPPVVTIMGHVDHGKTTLLDAIRESRVVESEFGGITQHIGAYVVEVNGQQVAFLDTPGHEAFTAMRARGVQVTDEVILVVAADDGIMPQTIEAIDHARAANVPIIVAINKIDLPGANPDRVMQELTKYGLTPEEWGGQTICVKVSAKKRTNLSDLLEMIVLQAEVLELKADPGCAAEGVIIEAMLDKGRGPVSTVLVREGTLRIGDAFVAGLHHGKVRAMFDDRGRKVKEAGPSIPVEVLGLTGVPVAGDEFMVVENDRIARQIADSRQQQQQQKAEALGTGKITLGELHQQIKEGGMQELRIVIKADVHGSVEALTDALERLSTPKVRLQVIHGGVGAINESDVMLAVASNAIVLGFNVRPVTKAREMAEKEQIELRLYTIIYHAIEDIKKAMEGLLEPTYKETLLGQAVVQATFAVAKLGTIAGCRVTNGKITRNAIVKLFRDHKEVYKGTIGSLRRIKDDVREVLNGYECGIKLENFNDIKVNDLIEAYTLEKVAGTLETAPTKQS